VFLRIRPASEVCPSYDFMPDKVVISQETSESQYSFTSVLNESVDQVQIYDKIVRSTLSKPFATTGATFASYGVSSSGKTYTILGDSDISAGLVPRAIVQIFTEFESKIAEFPCLKVVRDEVKELSDNEVMSEVDILNEYLADSVKMNKGKPLKSWSSERIKRDHVFQESSSTEDFVIDKLYVWISFVEIYNEKVTDLLYNLPAKSTIRTLKIYSNNGYSYIPGLTWLFVSNIADALKVLKFGLNKVSYEQTLINDHSSRSHTIFTINLIAENESGFQFSNFRFCDLAGAERAKKTGNNGERLKEASGINNSLLVLKRCMEAVHNQQKKKKLADNKIPVRESKLTLLIQTSLLGLEKFFMIVNLYPTNDFFHENVNVLKFGSIANKIEVRQAEVRKFQRQSFLMQQQMPNGIRNQLNGTYVLICLRVKHINCINVIIVTFLASSKREMSRLMSLNSTCLFN
jgi:kinesin family protein 20